MRVILLLILIAATATFSFQLYRLVKQSQSLKLEYARIDEQTGPVKLENERLAADIEYFQKPEGLEIELRKAGYALPDEKMLIIINEKQ